MQAVFRPFCAHSMTARRPEPPAPTTTASEGDLEDREDGDRGGRDREEVERDHIGDALFAVLVILDHHLQPEPEVVEDRHDQQDHRHRDPAVAQPVVDAGIVIARQAQQREDEPERQEQFERGARVHHQVADAVQRVREERPGHADPDHPAERIERAAVMREDVAEGRVAFRPARDRGEPPHQQHRADRRHPRTRGAMEDGDQHMRPPAVVELHKAREKMRAARARRALPDIALPPPASIAARIDLPSRIKAFDGGDDTLVAQARELWTIIEPDAGEIVDAYWDHWRAANPGAPTWTPMEGERRRAAGVAYLRNRFCHLEGIAWVESLERSVAAAYAAGVETMELLAMSYDAPHRTGGRTDAAVRHGDRADRRPVRRLCRL
ncbi:hypothetical protein WR25_03172 [Diploscapter pachys]|uniref:Uncharacterized protein n=1 Tax=Diploscapter pachys TaxID=2018661 RepID=A0A2A2K130_9BILA|nr:hypothetical protein WR25_03172 [Diploscapter pachys]